MFYYLNYVAGAIITLIIINTFTLVYFWMFYFTIKSRKSKQVKKWIMINHKMTTIKQRTARGKKAKSWFYKKKKNQNKRQTAGNWKSR